MTAEPLSHPPSAYMLTYSIVLMLNKSAIIVTSQAFIVH